MPFRLFPLVVFACTIFIALKVADIIDRKQSVMQALLGAPLRAEEPKKKEGGEKDAEEHKDKEEHMDSKNVHDEKAQNDKDKKGVDVVKTEGAPDSEPATVKEEFNFSKAEIDILQRLAQRREELDRRQSDIEVKETVLQITQKKIDQKIADLRLLKADVDTLLAQYNEKEDAKIKSLVKIYENMKPKDAAEIFENLEMDTLLQVISKMSERKIAPILAQMSPERAKELTVEFANRRKLHASRAKQLAENKK